MNDVRPFVCEVTTAHSPESLVERLRSAAGIVLLRSGFFESPQARYSFVTAQPFLTFRSFGSRCELTSSAGTRVQFGNPWHLLDALMSRCEMLDELDLPFPLGGCFGYWGYDLKNFVEPKLSRNAVNDLELPDCVVGFYSSLVVFDHRLDKTWIVSTGVREDGSRDERIAEEELTAWQKRLHSPAEAPNVLPVCNRQIALYTNCQLQTGSTSNCIQSNLSRSEFISRVERAQRYIRAGDIYQVNLSHRLSATVRGAAVPAVFPGETPAPQCSSSGWELFQQLVNVSPAPFSAYLDCGEFQVASSSPELFLRLSGSHILTRPIKGTRPRSADSTRDAQLTYELQTSSKEMAELVMITDLLRNDLGRVCEYGSVQVPELVRLERYPQVQHLVSTVEGRLRADVTHFAAFASCFPGGSVTGAPKIRAMEIIDELEPITRGPYTGALGYLGFNRESQLSIIIRTAVTKAQRAHFNVGAGIVADSNAEAEYEETMAKARGFLTARNIGVPITADGARGATPSFLR